MTECASAAEFGPKRARSKLLGILKTTVWVGAGVLSVVGAIWLVATWLAYRNLQARLAELRSSGLPITIGEIFELVGPEGEQVAQQIEEAVRSFPGSRPGLDDLWRRYGEAEDWPTESDIEFLCQLARGPEWKPARDTVARVASGEGLLLVAKKGQGSGQPEDDIIVPLLDWAESVRRLNRFTTLWAEYYFAAGDSDQALEIVCLGLRLNRVQLPFVVGGLVRQASLDMHFRSANKILQKASVSEQRLAELEGVLRSIDVLGSWQKALATERVFGLDQFRRLPCAPVFCNLFLFGALQNYLDTVDLVGVYLELTAGRHRNLRESDLRTALEAAARSRWSFLNPLVELVVPAFSSARNALARGIILRNCLLVLISLKKAGGEAKPEEVLAQLPEDFRWDPFSGGNLRVVTTEAGWLIYSVGPDGIDDGGDLAGNKDWGIGPPT